MHLTVYPLRGPDHDSSVEECMYLTVCPPRGPGSISSRGREFPGIFPWLITHTLGEDVGAHITSSLKGCEEYVAASSAFWSPLTIKMVMGY